MVIDMVEKKGYGLIEVLIGVFLLGLLVITVFPIIQTANSNFMLVETKMNMSYLAETILETIKAFDYLNCEDEYILDIKLVALIDLLNSDGEVIVNLPLGKYDNKYPYKIVISKYDINKQLWKVIVEVKENKYKGRIQNVFYESYISKPKKQLN